MQDGREHALLSAGMGAKTEPTMQPKVRHPHHLRQPYAKDNVSVAQVPPQTPFSPPFAAALR